MPRSPKKPRASSSSAGGDSGESQQNKSSTTTSIRYEQVFPATKIKAQLYQQIDMPTIAQGPLEVVNVASALFVQQLLALCDVPPGTLMTSDHLRQAVLTAASDNHNQKTGQTRKRKTKSSQTSKDGDDHATVDFGFLEPVLDESFPEESTTAKVKAYVPPKRTKKATTTSTKSKKQIQEALSSVTVGQETTIPRATVGDIEPDEEDYD